MSEILYTGLGRGKFRPSKFALRERNTFTDVVSGNGISKERGKENTFLPLLNQYARREKSTFSVRLRSDNQVRNQNGRGQRSPSGSDHGDHQQVETTERKKTSSSEEMRDPRGHLEKETEGSKKKSSLTAIDGGLEQRAMRGTA